MQQYLLLGVILLIPSLAVSQEKEISKVKQLMERGKYQRAIRKAKKAWEKHPQMAETNFLRAKAHFHFAKDSTRPDAGSHADHVRRFYSNALVKDRRHTLCHADTLFRNSLRAYFSHQARQLYSKGKHRQANELTLFSTLYLKDTTELHITMQQRNTRIAVQQPQPVRPVNPVVAVNKKGKIYFRKPAHAPSRDAVLEQARRYLGTQYKWGGETPEGFDCSGFILAVMRHFGYDFTHHAATIAYLGQSVAPSHVKRGDLVFFGSRYEAGQYRVSHMGIVESNVNGEISVIHCVSRGVCTDNISQSHWAERVLFFKNILDEPQAAAAQH